MRVLDVLNYVYDQLDVPIAYRWFCGTKKCGECAITVDGKPTLACWEEARDHMTCDPLTNFPIIRDLVVDRVGQETVVLFGLPQITRSVHPAFPEKLPHSSMERAHRLMKCIECNACTAAVPIRGLNRLEIDWGGYAGPAALVRYARFYFDPRDETAREPRGRAMGAHNFPLYSSLRDICPQGIDIIEDALRPMRDSTKTGVEGLIDHAGNVRFIKAPQWTAFVRLEDGLLSDLVEKGVLRRTALGELPDVYALQV
jgi:succinate dehydrogenase/fumarate reductase iron-sulfur protein